jgi:hypothetical protein
MLSRVASRGTPTTGFGRPRASRQFRGFPRASVDRREWESDRLRTYGRPFRSRSIALRLLQFHENDVGWRVPDVLAVMLLRRQPTDGARLQLDFSLKIARHQPSAERAQRVHHDVRVLMRRGAVSAVVLVFENSDPLVLEDDPVMVGVGDGWVEAHAGRMPPLA